MVTDGETIIYRKGWTPTARSHRTRRTGPGDRFEARSEWEDRIRELEDRVAELEKRLRELTERSGAAAEPDLPASVAQGQGASPSELKVSFYAAHGGTAVVGPARFHVDET